MNEEHSNQTDYPIKYKNFLIGKIQSGRSARTDGVGYLKKDRLLVSVSQIRGCCGRFLLAQDNGEFIKVGWINHDLQNLLLKVDTQKNILLSSQGGDSESEVN